MNKIKVDKPFSGYGVIDDMERYEETKKLNADRDVFKDEK